MGLFGFFFNIPSAVNCLEVRKGRSIRNAMIPEKSKDTTAVASCKLVRANTRFLNSTKGSNVASLPAHFSSLVLYGNLHFYPFYRST